METLQPANSKPGQKMRRWEIGVLIAASCAAAVPVWLVENPPFQDLPEHLAAIRVLYSYDDPAFGFHDYFHLDLLRTQYLGYYVPVWLIAHLTGIIVANKVVLSLAIAGLPLSLANLMRVTGRHPLLGLLALPIVYNAYLMLGLFHFVSAFPLMLWGLALAIEQSNHPTKLRGVGLFLISLACFYMHVMPFLMLLGAIGILSIRKDWRKALYVLGPVAPTIVWMLIWSQRSGEGRVVFGAALDQLRNETLFDDWSARIEKARHTWLTMVLRNDADDHALFVWAVAIGAAIAWGLIRFRKRTKAPFGTWRLALLLPVSVFFYFVATHKHEWIWPIAGRFPLFAMVFLPLLIADVGVWPSRIVGAVALVAGLYLTTNVGEAFVHFERSDLGDFDAIVEEIPPRSRVAALIFDRGSTTVEWNPFLHYACMYQFRKGGAAMYSFADAPMSAHFFREDNRPPRLPLGWEWMPQRVDPERDLRWYDYVITRGGPGRIRTQLRAFEVVATEPPWRLWRRLE